MKVLLAIDSLFAWLLHQPLRLLCGLMGKSNFFFARAAVVISALCFFWSWAVTMVLDPSVWNGIHAALGCLFWTWICFGVWLHLRAIETKQGQVEDALVSCRTSERALRMIAIFFFILDTILLGPWVGLIDFVCWIGFALYFAYDFQPRSKSWLRRGIDALKSSLSKIRLPNRRWTPGLQGG